MGDEKNIVKVQFLKSAANQDAAKIQLCNMHTMSSKSGIDSIGFTEQNDIYGKTSNIGIGLALSRNILNQIGPKQNLEIAQDSIQIQLYKQLKVKKGIVTTKDQLDLSPSFCAN